MEIDKQQQVNKKADCDPCIATARRKEEVIAIINIASIDNKIIETQ